MVSGPSCARAASRARRLSATSAAGPATEIDVGDGDELGGRVDRLDPAGGEPLRPAAGRRAATSSRASCWGGARGEHALRAGGIPLGSVSSEPTSQSGDGDAGLDGRPSHSTVTTSFGIGALLDPVGS